MKFKRLLKSIPLVGPFLQTGYRFLKLDPTGRIKSALKNEPHAFIVQIGSNDGRTGDPIFKLIQQNPTWEAMFVEPVPFLFERLRENYGTSARFRFENLAIGETRGMMPFHYISAQALRDMPDLPEWYDQLGSFDRDHITKHVGKQMDPYIVSMAVPVESLNELLERHGVTTIDLLHLDTEGYDWKILKHLDLDRFKVKTILFEHKHLDPSAKVEAKEKLGAYFTIKDLGNEYLCLESGSPRLGGTLPASHPIPAGNVVDVA